MEEETRATDENKALLAYSIDNKDLSEITDPIAAMVAIEGILHKHGPVAAVNCLPFTLYWEEVAGYLDAQTKSTRHRPDFVRAMVNLFALDIQELAQKRLHFKIPCEFLPKLVNSPDDLAVIIRDQKVKKDPIPDEQHAMALSLLKMDAYWERRVRRLIKRRDFRRAWDELYRALIGWPGKGKVKLCLNASYHSVGSMGDELYSAMQHAGAISQAGLKNWRRKASRDKTQLISLEHEQDRRIAALYSDRSVELEEATLSNVSQEGLTLLHLAAHFRKERNLRRAVKKVRGRAA